ncbi:MAG: hypothetical protein IJ881_01135 [Neisseriaceae bacterium]|nr:hypothetical protein [Neisseriaceae bacterium]
MAIKNGLPLPTTNELVADFLGSLSSFLVEMGNMAYNLKRYKETGEDQLKKNAQRSALLAVENIATLVTSKRRVSNLLPTLKW